MLKVTFTFCQLGLMELIEVDTDGGAERRSCFWSECLSFVPLLLPLGPLSDRMKPLRPRVACEQRLL